MKVFLISFFLGAAVALPVPHHLGVPLSSLGPGTKSTYHGVLGTFPVSPAQVYTPFGQSLGYQVPITYYTPGYLGYQYQFAGVPFLDSTLQIPVVPVSSESSVLPVGEVLNQEVVPNEGEDTEGTYGTTESQTETPQDSVDDDDTVTIESS